MPIIRTYACPECNHWLEVWVNPDQWDQPPPYCPKCESRTQQEFKPPNINGSAGARAAAIAYDIAEKDYGVSDIKTDRARQGSIPKVTYRDQTVQPPSTWGANREVLEGAVAVGRSNRMAMGGKDGLHRLQEGLKDGSIPDLIELSKKRGIKVW